MKAVCFAGVEAVSLESIPDAKIELPTDAIVKVHSAGLCGSDLHVFHGRETGIDIPTAMGHEFVGEVVEVGAAVNDIQVGSVVCGPFTTNCGTCFYCHSGLTSRCTEGQLFGWRQGGKGLHGGQAELVRVANADGTLVATEGLPADLALLLGDNLSTGFFCAELAEVKPGGTYVVVGCGTVGLICVMAARELGAEKIFAIDFVKHRLEVAKQFGAIAIDDPAQAVEIVAQSTAGRGADAVMELVGLPAAQKLAFDVLRPGGIISTIGCHCEPHFAFSPVDAYDKNLTYRTGRCPARAIMNRLKQPALDGHFDELRQLFTHRFSISDCHDAYDVFANRQDNCIKAVFDLTGQS